MEGSDYELIWTSAAKADLEDIRDYLGLHDPGAAVRVAEAIFEHADLLRMFPFIGPAVSWEADGVRWITCRGYRVLYQVCEDRQRVEVLGVWHGSRQAPPRL